MNEIGEILKEARIEKGYTLDDLQQTTKIQRRYLQAIEDGNTDILPGRFYARAFVKQYADIVGLDGEKLLEEHLNETSKQASEDFAEQVNVPPSRSTQAKRGQGVSSVQEYLPTVLIILLVVAIFGVIYFAWRQANEATGDSLINEQVTDQVAPSITEEENENVGQETPDDEDSQAADDVEDPADTEETEEDEAEAQEIAIAESTGSTTTYDISGPHPEEQILVLEASGGASWVSVNVIGQGEQPAMLNDGETLEITFGGETDEVFMIIGNAAATIIRLNDIELEYAPESAGVVRQDLKLQFSQ